MAELHGRWLFVSGDLAPHCQVAYLGFTPLNLMAFLFAGTPPTPFNLYNLELFAQALCQNDQIIPHWHWRMPVHEDFESKFHWIREILTQLSVARPFTEALDDAFERGTSSAKAIQVARSGAERERCLAQLDLFWSQMSEAGVTAWLEGFFWAGESIMSQRLRMPAYVLSTVRAKLGLPQEAKNQDCRPPLSDGPEKWTFPLLLPVLCRLARCRAEIPEAIRQLRERLQTFRDFTAQTAQRYFQAEDYIAPPHSQVALPEADAPGHPGGPYPTPCGGACPAPAQVALAGWGGARGRHARARGAAGPAARDAGAGAAGGAAQKVL